MSMTTLPSQRAETTVEPTEQKRGGRWYRPNVDIVESAEELTVVADVPGAKGDDIDIHFENGSLTLHARVMPRQPADTDLLLQEYGVGDFQRTFQLGESIDANRISAEYRDGVLTLHLPKVEAAKPRKIEVRTA
jgi:HSP20 family molecular chaperone IbpA